MKTEKISSIIESVLFVSSESMDIKHIKNIFSECGETEISISDILKAVQNLQTKYLKQDSGIELLCIENSYKIVSKADNNYYVEKILIKIKKKSLSQAALEVLSIVAYKQPVTKIEIDEIRGVKSDSVISNLIDNGLIYESGRLDKIGKPILYNTTEKFLIEFGINDLSQLPQYLGENSCNKQMEIGE